MIEEEFSKEELDIIGVSVHGTFDHYERPNLIYSSRTFRITVDQKTARKYIDDIVKGIIDNSKAD